MLTAEAQRQAAQERDKQIREERRAIYVEYLSAYRKMYSRAHALAAQGGCIDDSEANTARGALWRLFERVATEEVLDFSRSYYTVTISGSKKTREAADKATSTLWDLVSTCVGGNQVAIEEADNKTQERRRRLREEMRADLGID